MPYASVAPRAEQSDRSLVCLKISQSEYFPSNEQGQQLGNFDEIDMSKGCGGTLSLQAGENWVPVGAMPVCRPIRICARAAATAILTATFAAPAFCGASGGEVAVTCTNPASGASWRIAIDYDRGTVDSNPARISDTEISWRDANNGWNYTLDRKSGKLTVVLASATGGNFLYDRCSVAN